LLGWEPRVALDDGLRRTVAYFRGLIARQGTAAAAQPASA
jgi:dTDP-D-glucose 4,6-dehydratase